MRTKLIGKYSQTHLAYIHKGILEENGIDAFIFGEHFMTTVPYFTGILNAGVELRVREEQWEEAGELLQLTEKESVVCMNCQSENLEFSFGKNQISSILFSLASVILLVLPFGNIQRQYFCKDCGFKMKNE